MKFYLNINMQDLEKYYMPECGHHMNMLSNKQNLMNSKYRTKGHTNCLSYESNILEENALTFYASYFISVLFCFFQT